MGINAKLTDLQDAGTLDGTETVYVVTGGNSRKSTSGQVATSNIYATRSALKSVDTTKITTAILTESGREGLFLFDASNLSSEVTADTQEGIYVSPDSDATGANGAWVRVTDGVIGFNFFEPNADGATDDESAITAWLSSSGSISRLSAGTFLSTGHTLSSPTTRKIFGDGPSARFKRDSDGGNFLALTTPTKVDLANFTIDMGFATNGNSGHGVSATDAVDLHIDRLRIEDFGNNGGSAGTGIIAAVSALTKNERVSITNSYAKGDVATSTDTNGFLLADTWYGRMHGNVAENVISFAHELKNDSRFCVLSDLIAINAAYAVGFGQTTVGDDGADFNACSNFVSYQCDVGLVVGEGDYNIFSAQTGDCTGSPGTDLYGIHFSTDATGNVHLGAISYGTGMDFPVRIRGDRNYAAIASHDTATNVVTFDSGVAKNHVNILHPGARTSIDGAVNDASGNSIRGTDANTVWSPATGEFIGSMSGHFHWKLGESGSGPLSTQEFWFESVENAILTLMVDSASATTAGMQINKGATDNFAGFYYNFASNYWQMQVNNTTVGRFSAAAWFPFSDDTVDLGGASNRFSEVFAATGTINTSDAREKTDVRAFTKAEITAAKEIAQEIGFFRYLASVETKGKDGAREHCGMTVQRAIEIMKKHQLDPFGYGFICHNEWDEEWADEERIVLDADGKPVMDEIDIPNRVKVRDESGRRVRDEDGNQIWRDEPIKEKRPRTEIVKIQTRKAGDRYGFRPDQLNLFIMRGMEARLAALEGAAA